MDLIINDFLTEVYDIENSNIFEDDENEPKTEWIEEIDSRTNFPFYWNSNTKESVWDMPKDYSDYLIKYETYLRELIAKCHKIKRLEIESNNDKNTKDMKGLIEYSDSEDDAVDNVENTSLVDKSEENRPEEIDPVEENTEEDFLMKKEQWMSDQADETEKYLINITKKMSETILKKVDYFSRENFVTDQIKEIAIQVMTRLEDWNDGHLTLERKVEKLREALVEISSFEANLGSDKWNLVWNSDKNQYFCTSLETGKVISELQTVTKKNCEEGEIIEDDDDIALDLEEYVSSTLHRSLLQDSSNNNGVDDETFEDKFVNGGDSTSEKKESNPVDQEMVEACTDLYEADLLEFSN